MKFSVREALLSVASNYTGLPPTESAFIYPQEYMLMQHVETVCDIDTWNNLFSANEAKSRNIVLVMNNSNTSFGTRLIGSIKTRRNYPNDSRYNNISLQEAVKQHPGIKSSSSIRIISESALGDQ